MGRDVHPQTGAHYAVFFPRNASFIDLRLAYIDQSTPWLSVHDADRFDEVFAELRDSRSLLLHWTPDTIAEIPSDRRAAVAGMFFEAYDPDLTRLAPEHRADFDRLLLRSVHLDAIGLHTPWMAQQIGRETGRPTFVLPHGMNPSTMGVPDFAVEKRDEACFYGSRVGKRPDFFSKLSSFGMGKGYRDLSSLFGAGLLREVNRAKVVLNIYHYDVASYSTWRLFQAASTSAVLVTEDGDHWPLSSENCIVLPWRASVDTAYGVVVKIVDLSQEEAFRISRDATAELMNFTTRRCIDDYLVPGTEFLLR